MNAPGRSKNGPAVEPAPTPPAEETSQRLDGLPADAARGLADRSELVVELGALLCLALHQLASFARTHHVVEVEREAREAIEELGEVGLPTVLVAGPGRPEGEALH